MHSSCSSGTYCNVCFNSTDETDLTSHLTRMQYDVGFTDGNDMFNDDFELHIEIVRINL